MDWGIHMTMVFGAWLDLVAALGLIAALSSVYARLRRVQRYPRFCQLLMGVCFGLVALFEMYHPIEPFEGLIIDLRTVPIALAGAFLNWPATLVTTGISLIARASIGGLGMWAGMLGMLLAMGASRLWLNVYRARPKRGFMSGVVLAAMMSVHLVGGLVLPTEIAHWFFSVAAPIILLLNMLTVPMLAAVLEAERRSFETEQSLRSSATVDADTGLMSLPALLRECAVRATALGDGSYTHALIVRIRPPHMMSVWNTRGMQKRLVAAMRMRLSLVLPNCDLASIHGSSALVLPLTQAELLNIEDTKTCVRRAATEDPYALNGTCGHRISIDLYVHDCASETATLDALLDGKSKLALGRSRTIGKRLSHTKKLRDIPRRSDRQDDPKLQSLFAKADFLMKQKSGVSMNSG